MRVRKRNMLIVMYTTEMADIHFAMILWRHNFVV